MVDSRITSSSSGTGSFSDVGDGTDVEEIQAEVERLSGEVRAMRQCIAAMQELADSATRPVDDSHLIPMLQRVLEAVMSSVSAEDGSLMVLDEDTHELVFVASHGTIGREHLAWRRLPPGEGVAGWVVQNRRATVVNDVQLDDRFYPALDQELNFRTNSLVAAPIVSGDTVLGVIEVLNKPDGKQFNVGDQQLITLVCRFAGEMLDSVIRRSAQVGTISGDSGTTSGATTT